MRDVILTIYDNLRDNFFWILGISVLYTAIAWISVKLIKRKDK